MFGPNLDGNTVRLAPVAPTMLPAFCEWLADPLVTRYLGFPLIFPPSAEMEAEWLQKIARSSNDIVWAVFAGDDLIGTTGIHAIDWGSRAAITGNLIGAREHWGKGYGSEAVALRTRYAFETLGLESLTTYVFAENVGSRRALEKSGYRHCGTYRRRAWRHGRWHDFWLGEVLRDEWLAAQEAATT